VEKIGLVGISTKIAGREPNEGGSRVDARRSIVNGSDQLWRWSCSMYVEFNRIGIEGGETRFSRGIKRRKSLLTTRRGFGTVVP
jgi:hypothetical protein